LVDIGFTIGFAIKEIANNFISGLLLVWDKPFSRGQHLRVMVASQPPLEGTVQSIDSRYVVLKTAEGKKLMIPSVVVYTNSLVVGPAADALFCEHGGN
jgi:small conductance mechanosensitive channel